MPPFNPVPVKAPAVNWWTTKIPSIKPQPKRLKPRATGEFVPPKGQKEVWLPNFTITLLNTTYLPPNMACFQVPLNMNKLDLKDYLWNAYKVPVLHVRSYVQQQKIRQAKSGQVTPRARYWSRPKSTKRMIIEMADGEHGGLFVFPEVPEDLEPWDKELYDDLAKENKESGGSKVLEKKMGFPEDHAKLVATQAKELLDGGELWRPTVPVWNRPTT